MASKGLIWAPCLTSGVYTELSAGCWWQPMPPQGAEDLQAHPRTVLILSLWPPWVGSLAKHRGECHAQIAHIMWEATSALWYFGKDSFGIHVLQKSRPLLKISSAGILHQTSLSQTLNQTDLPVIPLLILWTAGEVMGYYITGHFFFQETGQGDTLPEVLANERPVHYWALRASLGSAVILQMWTCCL